MDALKEGSWAPDEPAPLHADDQVKLRSLLLAAIRYFADNGEFHGNGDYNQLLRGIWEIKRWHIRITFFDTDGHGNYTPKTSERIHTGGGGYCPLPDFDEYIRLGTVFEKTTSQTPRHQIDAANQIRDEDLAHDKET